MLPCFVLMVLSSKSIAVRCTILWNTRHPSEQLEAIQSLSTIVVITVRRESLYFDWLHLMSMYDAQRL